MFRDWDDEIGLKVFVSKSNSRIQYNAVDYIRQIVSELKEINGYRGKGKKRSPLLHWYFFASHSNSRLEKPLTPDGLRTAWSKAMKAAIESGELTQEQRFQERDLRAKVASDCINISQASELLGHMNMSTTKRVYRRGYSIVDPLSPSESSTKKQSIEK